MTQRPHACPGGEHEKQEGGIVACGHPATGRAATAILDDGGNAFDAVLAAMCAACVAEPVLASLGGGGFLLARTGQGGRTQRPVIYDFFPQTPKARRPSNDVEFYPIVADFGPVQQEFHIGMGSIATPGAVRGLFEVHRELGFMPIRRVVEPAIALARDGIEMNSLQAYFFGIISPIFKSTEASRTLFARPGDPEKLVGEGDLLRLPEFADALETLSIEGEDLFYRGEIAQAVAADCKAHGGHLTADDFAGYRVERRMPLAVDAFSARLLMNPPPSNGGILIAFALALLSDDDFAASGFASAGHIQHLSRVMGATNRARLEQDLHEMTPDAAARTFLDPALVDAYRQHLLGRPWMTRGTTHISVIDADGNAAGLSLTNGEGAGYIAPGTGIMLNNILGEDDINPHGFGHWPRDARLSSMMCPTIALTPDGGVTVLGSGGSNRLRTAILQVLLNLLVFKMPIEDAVAMPRMHLEGETLSIEPGIGDALADARDEPFTTVDRWERQNMFFGGVHAVRREEMDA